MQMKATLALTILIIVTAILISLLVYPKMPDRMASHWNSSGQVDGCIVKPVALFFSPALMLFILPLSLLVFLIEPAKRMGRFLRYYAGLVVLINLFLLAIHGWMILWNMGITISSNVFMPIAIACLFFYVGIMVSHIEPAPGWPTRWPCPPGNSVCALKSARLTGILFKLAAIIALFGAVFPRCATAFIVLPVFVIVFIILVHSVVIARRFRREA